MIKPASSQAEDIIDALRSGNFGVVEMLYSAHREAFFRWAARRFKATRQDFEDAWQDAVIAFYQQVQSGKIESLRYGVNTWLFAVGYKRLLNNHRKLKRIHWRDHIDDALLGNYLPDDLHQEAVAPEKKQHLEAAMKIISPQCREMLVQRYYFEQSIEDIRREWELQNLNTASATLSRCLKRLKEIIQKTLNAGG